MTFIWSLIEILVNIYQGMISTYFISSFLSFKKGVNVKLFYLVCGGIQSIMITVFNYVTIFENFASVLYFAELFLFACIMLQGNIIKKAFACIMPLFTIFAITVGVLNFYASINKMTIEEIVTDRSITRLLVLLSIQLLSYIVLKILLKLFKTDNNQFGVYDWSIIITVMVISLIQAGIIHYLAIRIGNESVRIYINISVVILLLLNILIYHLINSVRKKNDLEKELEVIKIQEHYQRQYIESSKQQYDAMKKIKHDTKNSFLAVAKLITDHKYEKALEITKGYTDTVSTYQTFVDTQNNIVNAVINSKLSYAASKGIKSRCMSVSNIAGIKDNDLCSILSNTLDNSISACLELPAGSDREISINIMCEEDHLYTFIIKNTIDRSVLETNPDLISTKKDKQEHGYGTRIIQDIAQKYSGRVDFYEEQNKFCCRIDLFTD